MTTLSDCPICGGTGKEIDQVRTIHPESVDMYGLVACGECSHWWVNPMPKQDYLNILYREGSEFVVPKHWGGDIQQKVFSKAEKHIITSEVDMGEKKYLEIGVGGGHLFKHFLKKNGECYGVEPGDWCESENIYKDVKDIPNELIFDVIAACDVIEHVENPIEMLVRLREVAAPSARLYCAFPNADSFHARYKKGNWRMVRPLGHLHFFSRKSVQIAMEHSGWMVDKLIQTGTIDMRNPANLREPRTALVGLAESLGFADQWMCESCCQED